MQHTSANAQTQNTLFIMRRKQGGYGGAEKVMERFALGLQQDWNVRVVTAGSRVAGCAIGALYGPNWWRAYRYAIHVNRLLQQHSGSICFSMERGPKAHMYRAGDGVHSRWIELRYGKSRRWMFNPWHWLAPRLERQTLASVAVIIANSHMVKQDIARFYPAWANKVTVVYNGYDSALFKPTTRAPKDIRRSLNLPLEGKLLLFCGSGWERKGLSVCLEFLAKAQRVAPAQPIHLVVVGKGKPQCYHRRIAQLGLEKAVLFHPPTREVTAYYQAADTLLLPTAYDPFSNACLEALACDCPVITTCWNGAAEVIETGKTGYIMQSIAPEAIDATVLSWLNHQPTKGTVAQSVAAYTQAREMEQLQTLLRTLTSSR